MLQMHTYNYRLQRKDRTSKPKNLPATFSPLLLQDDQSVLPNLTIALHRYTESKCLTRFTCTYSPTLTQSACTGPKLFFVSRTAGCRTLLHESRSQFEAVQQEFMDRQVPGCLSLSMFESREPLSGIAAYTNFRAALKPASASMVQLTYCLS